MPFKFLTLDQTLQDVPSDVSENYWNDESLESKKIFNVKLFGIEKIENSKKYNALSNQLNELTVKNKIRLERSNVLSVASGTCWLESKWLKGRDFKKLVCVDLSGHRIHQLAPTTIELYGMTGDISLCKGSIFDYSTGPDDQFDIILMAQAFHHIEEPIRLLRFLDSILSPGGVIIIVGEPYYNHKIYFKRSLLHFIKYILNINGYRRLTRIFPSWQDLFPPDFTKGDIHWSIADYDFIFRKSSFTEYEHATEPTGRFQSFLLRKR